MFDCLVVSRSAISAHLFPWQLVTLLVEYEPVSVPLFSGGVSESVVLEEYLILRTVDDVLASSLAQGKMTCAVLRFCLLAQDLETLGRVVKV